MTPATETLIARILSRFGVHYFDFPAGATREEIDAVRADMTHLMQAAVEVGDVATGDDLDTPVPEPHPRFHD